MKAIVSTLVSIVAVSAFANPSAPAAKEAPKAAAATAPATTTTPAATTETKHEDKKAAAATVDCKDAKNKGKAECKATH